MVGFGKSKSAHIASGKKGEFVEQFMKAVKLNRPVLVCASMSGAFALPFVLTPDAATCTERLRGFVPIAPVGTAKFSQADYASCKVSFGVSKVQKNSLLTLSNVFTRDSIYAIAHICHANSVCLSVRPSVCPSVRHTRVLYQNG